MRGIKELIEKKKEGATHSEAELFWIVSHFTNGNIPDYQMSAWLMAVCFQGMSDAELSLFTQFMWKSGVSFPREERTHFWIDKHSTGGVGDKLSLLLVPLIAAFCEKYLEEKSIRIPMVSGRGLGFTGGTLDKLESVKNFSTTLSLKSAKSLLEENGYVMMGQTQEMTPCDQKMYALRDASGTVTSLPLVVASILSKKLSENLDGLVLDVKFGEGALFKDLTASTNLAQTLVRVAKENQCEALAVLTSMEEPLGYFSGNALEVYECLEILRGKPKDDRQWEVTGELFSNLIFLGTRKKIPREEAREKLEVLLSTNLPEKHLKKMFLAQGGDLAQFEKGFDEEVSKLTITDWVAPEDGYLEKVATSKIGSLINEIGGGRNQKGDTIDPWVGVESKLKIGEKVKKGATVFRIYSRKPIALKGENYYSLSKASKKVKMIQGII